MADAIWNNRFILADPGKNETVLFTGNVYETGADYALSENVNNFSKIEVWVQKRNGSIGNVGRAIQISQMALTFTSTGCLAYVNAIDIASNAYTQNTVYIQYNGDGTTFRLLAGTKFANGTFSNNVTTYDFVVTKIIGINRISGGN
jgi:hypothetical protein